MRWLALVLACTACRSTNYLVVDVAEIPCDAVSLHVTVDIDGDSETHDFTDSSALDDGASDFVVDLQSRDSGTVTVTVEALAAGGGSIGVQSAQATLPAGTLTVDMMGSSDCTASGCWPLPPSNFDCMTLPDSIGPLTINMDQTFDTDLGGFGEGYPVGVGTYWLVHASTVHVPLNVKWTVVGHRPLIIVAESDVTIEGEIIAMEPDTSSPQRCLAISGDVGMQSAPGGGGGGFGSAGGNGGLSASGNGTPGKGGDALEGPMLIPLVPGCPGAAGGTAISGTGAPIPGVPGGAGGGALEISSRTSIAVPGQIQAWGTGGRGGTSGGTCGAFQCATGGGGGGSGGAILLEAPQVTIDGAVCADGGGGGQGGSPGQNAAGGTSGDCTLDTHGAGGVGAGGGGSGGNAAPSAQIFGGVGMSGGGGGGGGGGQGRIHIHGAVSGGGRIEPPAM